MHSVVHTHTTEWNDFAIMKRNSSERTRMTSETGDTVLVLVLHSTVLTADTTESDACVAAVTHQLGGAISSLVYLVTRRAVRQVDHGLITVTPQHHHHHQQQQQQHCHRRRHHNNLRAYCPANAYRTLRIYDIHYSGVPAFFLLYGEALSDVIVTAQI